MLNLILYRGLTQLVRGASKVGQDYLFARFLALSGPTFERDNALVDRLGRLFMTGPYRLCREAGRALLSVVIAFRGGGRPLMPFISTGAEYLRPKKDESPSLRRKIRSLITARL